MTNPTPRDDFREVRSDGNSKSIPRPVVTVLGAGVTGLTIAHECAERGFIVQVIEAQQAPGDAGGVAVGGIAKTQYAVSIEGERFTRPPVPYLPWLAIGHGGGGGSLAYSSGNTDARGVTNERKVGVIAARLRAYREKLDLFDASVPPLEVRVVGIHDQRPLGPEAQAGLDQAVAQARHDLAKALGQDPRFTLIAEVEHRDPGAATSAATQPAWRIDVRPIVEGITLPGDHGYRFFPAFYRHIFDTMRRTAVFDRDEATSRTAFENLVPTLEISVAREHGRATHDIVKKRARSLEDVRSLFTSVSTGLGWSAKDMVRYGFFVLKYLTSCIERRTEYETGRYEERLRNDLGLPRVNPTRTWFDFIMGRSDLSKGLPYSDDFLSHLRSTSQALIAMSEHEVDIQTFGNVQMQLLLDHVRTGDDTDMSLNGPTSEAWLRHWKSHLSALGVRFFPGCVEKLVLDERGELYPTVRDADSHELVSLAPSASATQALAWRDETGGHAFLVPCADTDGTDDVSRRNAIDSHRSFYWASALALDELWLLLGSVAPTRAQVSSDISIAHVADHVFEAVGTHATLAGTGRYEAGGNPGIILAYSAAVGTHAGTPAGDLIVARLSGERQLLDRFPGNSDFDLHLVTTTEGNRCAVLCESGMLDRSADFEAVGVSVATIEARVFGFRCSRDSRRDVEPLGSAIASPQAGLGPTFRQLDRWRLETEAETGKVWRDGQKPSGHFLRGYTFRDFSGLQYFWDFDFRFNKGHRYFPDSEYGLSSICQPQFWTNLSYQGYRSIVSVDIGNLYRGYRTSLALADRYRANPKTRFVPHPSSVWESTREELELRAWDQMRRGMPESLAERLPFAQHVHVDDFIEYGPREGRVLPRRNLAPFLISAPGRWQRNRPSRTGYRPTMIGEPSDSGAWYVLPQTLDWYEINNRRWVVAGPHMKTFTRMTTMEAANESARHAVNRILHHMGFELDRNDRCRPGFGTSGLFVGDFCAIWNMVDHELAHLEGLKRLDQRLLADGLPHAVDILDLEPRMEAILASMDVAGGVADVAKAVGSLAARFGNANLPIGGGPATDHVRKLLEDHMYVPNILTLLGKVFDPAALSSAAAESVRAFTKGLVEALRGVDTRGHRSGTGEPPSVER